MRASVALIDKARTLCQPPTYYRLAKKLEIGHQTLSRVRNRGGTLDNEAATRLAELLGQPPMDVIAIMESERAKTPEKKAFWERRLPRFVPVVASLGIITGVTYVAIFGSNLSNYLYIMRSALRRWRPSLTACSSFA